MRGCLLGGAIGDALGWPVEFLSWREIQIEHGSTGITAAPVNGRGDAEISDDTQMTLFTVDGLIAAGPDPEPAGVASAVYQAHLRWLATQSGDPPTDGWRAEHGWLARQGWLYQRRAPGTACLSGLRSGRMGTVESPQNPHSKGCGAVMRSAPFGLVPSWTSAEAFALAVRCATQTHGHPTGHLAAGAFAAMIRTLLDGRDLYAAVEVGLDLLAAYPEHAETAGAIGAALAAVESGGDPGVESVEALGGGWVAEEALAIAVYCALVHPDDVRAALVLAVNHSGDSDSTGSICGNLLGTWHGAASLPAAWVGCVEGRDTIERIADELADRRIRGTPQG